MKKTLRRLAPVALVLVALVTLSFMAKDGVTLRLRPQHEHVAKHGDPTNLYCKGSDWHPIHPRDPNRGHENDHLTDGYETRI